MTVNTSIPKGAALLLDFIAKPESGGSYTVIYGHHENTLPHPITSMSVDALIATQASWGKKWGSSAAGRYQFMPSTLTSLKPVLKLTGTELFTPDLQDRLAYALLQRRGFNGFVTKVFSLHTFAKQLAEEWASMPVLEDTAGAHRAIKRGQSYYAGDALNKALVSPEAFEAVLTQALDVSHPVAAAVPSNPSSAAPSIAERVQTAALQEVAKVLNLPTIVQWIIALLPGVPDDIALVEAEVKELASSDTGAQKIAAALVFAQNIVNAARKALGKSPVVFPD